MSLAQKSFKKSYYTQRQTLDVIAGESHDVRSRLHAKRYIFLLASCTYTGDGLYYAQSPIFGFLTWKLEWRDMENQLKNYNLRYCRSKVCSFFRDTELSSISTLNISSVVLSAVKWYGTRMRSSSAHYTLMPGVHLGHLQLFVALFRAACRWYMWQLPDARFRFHRF